MKNSYKYNRCVNMYVLICHNSYGTDWKRTKPKTVIFIILNLLMTYVRSVFEVAREGKLWSYAFANCIPRMKL
jgi:hypothetical protein